MVQRFQVVRGLSLFLRKLRFQGYRFKGGDGVSAGFRVVLEVLLRVRAVET